MRFNAILYTLFATLLLTSLSAAGGYGTSSISLSQAGITLKAGATGWVNYTVNLASGGTWGTTLNIVNQQSLLSSGVNVTASNPNGEPPYSGVLTIMLSSTVAPGTYNVTLNATGDDPTTNSTTLAVVVPAPTTATTTVAGSNTTTANTTSSAATSWSTTVAGTSGGSGSSGGSWGSSSGSGYAGLLAGPAPLVGALVVLILGIVAIIKAKSKEWKMVFVGMMLILIGILIWLYGDFSGGKILYIIGGILASLVGIFVWLSADFRWKMFSKMNTSAYMIILAVILLLAGICVWIYADYGGGSMTDLWAGVGAMVLGVIVWLAAYFVK